jgi:polyhydroxybutyrate depolymerase
MLIVHGRRDEAFPVRGGEPRAPVTARRLSVTETVSVWRRIDGCSDEASARGRGGSLLYANCSTASTLAFVGVEGGEHDWFHTGPGYQLNRQDVDAANLIDRFFFERPSFALPAPRGSAMRARSYFVYVPPSYRADQPMPAVVMLHGRPSTATGMAVISEMNEVAERRGFIVVYPEGINNEWNAFYDLVRQRSATPQDDVRFLRTLMADLRVDLNIDPHRMYIAGFSNGGFMALRMACWASETFAGFASVGAGLYDALRNRCRSEPAPVLIMHGTGDPSVPYRGVTMPDPQGGEPTRLSLGAQDTVAFFIRRNRCSFSGPSTTFAERGGSPGTHVVRFAPRDCANGDDVMFYLINGGGHNWPGVRGVLDEDTFGPVNMDINAGEVIWDFFAEHSLAELPPPR